MNKQKVFSKVVKHLLTQGKKSKSRAGVCKYRGNQGAMCAIGCLITDEAYRPVLESKSVESYLVSDALKASGIGRIDGTDLNLLDALQRCHDLSTVDVWPIRLGNMDCLGAP